MVGADSDVVVVDRYSRKNNWETNSVAVDKVHLSSDEVVLVKGFVR
jgi:hypothetical protein